MSRRKKVKFADSASVRELSCQQDVSSLQTEKTRTHKFYEAKTSEYKSFKKLLEETGKKLHYDIPKHGINLKTFETSDSMAELNNSNRGKYDSRSSVLPVLKVTPIAQRSSLSPAKVSENCELNKTNAFKYDVSMSLPPIQKVTPSSQGPFLSHAKVSQNCVLEQKYEHEGIFTKRRENILKLAAETLSLEMDDFISHRSDLISGFLERLGAEIKSSSTDELSKSEHEKSDGIGHLLASSKSNGYLEESSDITRTDFSENTPKKHLGKELLPYKCREADDLIHSSMNHVETKALLTWHGLGTGLQCKKRKYQWTADDGRTSDLPGENESTSTIEWNTDFGNSYRFDTMEPKSDCFIRDSSPHYHFTKQSCVPVCKTEHERSNGIDHLLASSNLDGYLDQLLERTGTDFSETTARNNIGGEDLLSYRYRNADDCISSSADYFEAQAFQTWLTLGTGIESKRTKSKWIFDEGRISDLPAQSKSVPATEWNTDYRYHTTDHKLSKPDDFFPNRSRRQFLGQSLVPFLKSEPAETNGIDHLLASSKLEAYLGELHETEGTGFCETTTWKPLLGEDLLSYRCSEADDLISSSMDLVEAQTFPTRNAIGTDLDCRRRYKSASAIEWNAYFGFNNSKRMDRRLTEIDNFPSHVDFKGQSRVPFLDSTSSKLCDSRITSLLLQPAIEQCTLQLLGRDEKLEKEPEFFVASVPVVPKRMVQFPLTLNAAPDLLDRTKFYCCIDGYERRERSDSSPCSDRLITL